VSSPVAFIRCMRVVYVSFLLSFYLSVDHRYLHSFSARRSSDLLRRGALRQRPLHGRDRGGAAMRARYILGEILTGLWRNIAMVRSEEHTSELQSRFDLVCRLLLEKKNTKRERESASEKAEWRRS